MCNSQNTVQSWKKKKKYGPNKMQNHKNNHEQWKKISTNMCSTMDLYWVEGPIRWLEHFLMF